MISWVVVLPFVLSIAVIAWCIGYAMAPVVVNHGVAFTLRHTVYPGDQHRPPSWELTDRQQIALGQIEDALVEHGWVHQLHIDDPTHHDKAGRYMWWGM